jgi:hypothetical protein
MGLYENDGFVWKRWFNMKVTLICILYTDIMCRLKILLM